MAWYGKSKTDEGAPVPVAAQPRSVVASATRFDFAGKQTWKTFRGGDTAWQTDAWYQYDINGELRYAVNWLGNAASLADLYVADVDPQSGKATQPTDNETVRTIARSILGGPTRRARVLKTLMVNLAVPGEVFLLVRSEPDADEDRWLTLSTTEISGGMGGDVQFVDPLDGEQRKVNPEDLIIRIWSPHPRIFREADSSVRAVLPTLREIERASQNIAARLDSRLASAGLLILPDDVDFPREDDDPEGAEGFMQLMARTMAASLSEPGNASTQVPITITVPAESVDKIAHLTFDTPVSSEVLELRDKAIDRVATGMDLPREMLLGMGQSNHWSAFQVEDATFKTHIAPLLDSMAEDLTTAYLRPMLDAAEIPNSDRYMIAFDASAIISKGDRLADMKMLWDAGLVSDDALLTSAGVSEDEKPTTDEAQRRMAERLVSLAATLVADPRIANILGLPPVDAAAAGVAGADTTALPEGDSTTARPAADPTPATPVAVPPPPPATPPGDTPPVQASAAASYGPTLAASIAVEHALSRAGARLLNANRARGQYQDVPQHEIHTRVRPADDQLSTLLAGAWDGAAHALADTYRLDGYARVLLSSGAAHTPDLLSRWMHAAQTLGEQAPAALVTAAATRG